MPKIPMTKKHPTITAAHDKNNSSTSVATTDSVSLAAVPHVAGLPATHSPPPTVAGTADSIRHSNATITRKRLFQFLFKNYIKSAYSGLAGEPTEAADAPNKSSLPSAANIATTSATGPSALSGGQHHHTVGKITPSSQSATATSTSTSSSCLAYGIATKNVHAMATNTPPSVASASKVSTTSSSSSSPSSTFAQTATAATLPNASHTVPGASIGSTLATATAACAGGGSNVCATGVNAAAPHRSAIAMRKQELRTEYFNDMSECYTQSQRHHCVEEPSKTSATRQQHHHKLVASALEGPTKATTIHDNDRQQSRCVDTNAVGYGSQISAGSLDCMPSTRDTSDRSTNANPVAVATPISNSRAMTVTQLMDRQITQNDDIGWGKKVSVTLVREPTTSFGVCIVGGKVNISKNLQVAGIFVKNIVPASPAETCEQIKIGDRILSVNRQDVRNASQEDTIGLIKNAGCRIDLELQSFDGSNIPDPSTVPLKSAIKTDNGKRNRSVKISDRVDIPDIARRADDEGGIESGDGGDGGNSAATTMPHRTNTSASDSSSSDDEEAEESSGKVTTKAGVEIDRKSAGNLKRTKEEAAADPDIENCFGYTDQKLKKRYGPLGGRIIRANIQRDDGSLGIALAGHRDRTKMGCFVAGINPKGSASSQDVKVGDEILEISGTYLHQMCHLNASVIIKGIPGISLEFIFLRLENAVDEMAVKPVVSFPTVFDQFDTLYSCFKNVRNVTIQKVGTSLGIMIIEGKHSEVGQGIFISDIQENSNAENAGVKVGEMVLAVNKDLLIDTNYDTAATLLKRAEGIVTLTLCNPNKKEGEPDGKVEDSAAKAEPKKPEKPPEPEKPKDPATDEIEPNKDTLIELNVEKKPLGIVAVKGDSSQVQSGASVIVIHPNGAVHKDGRLKVFDKIVEIDGKKISSETSDHEMNKIFQSHYHKVKMTVYRADPPDLKEMDVEINKKSGKEIGLSFAECKDNGIYVLDIMAGSEVDKDKRMIRGDIVTHINGDDIRKCNFIESTVLLKAAQSKITFKVVRPKGKK